MITAKSIVQAALGLSRKSRAALAEKLLASLDDDQCLLDAAQEASRRMDAYNRGEKSAANLPGKLLRLCGREGSHDGHRCQ